MKSHAIFLFLLLTFAGGLRLYYFSGFVMGDDPGYAEHAEYIVNDSYPPMGERSVFSGRPLLLHPLGLSLSLFGWNDRSFIFPIFIASLLKSHIT
jgi:hypothetical protein